MECKDVVPLEDEQRGLFENFNGEGIYVESSEGNLADEPLPEETIKNKEGIINPSVPEIELPKDVAKITKSSESAQNPNTKRKNQFDSKGSAVFGRTSKQTLSQSLSLHVKGRHSDVMRKKSEVHNSVAKQCQKAAEKVEPNASNSNGHSNAVKYLGKGATRRASLHSLPNLRQSPSGKHVSADGTAAGPSSSVLAENNLEPTHNELPAKEEDEDDAHSITSSTPTPRAAQQRINVSVFSFRLEQRAAKRKEFFSKIEEKIHTKEQERSNLQAKSKENQEAEIKQLRKSLTFKATPMPSFYKEPLLKVELKKIPTTRAISPKLGRNKGNNMSMAGDSLEKEGSCVSPHKIKENFNNSTKVLKINADMANAVPKKFPKKSSLSKPQNQEPLAATTAKQTEKEGQKDQTKAESSDRITDQSSRTPEIEDKEVEPHESNAAQCNGSHPKNSEAFIAADVNQVFLCPE